MTSAVDGLPRRHRLRPVLRRARASRIPELRMQGNATVVWVFAL